MHLSSGVQDRFPWVAERSWEKRSESGVVWRITLVLLARESSPGSRRSLRDLSARYSVYGCKNPVCMPIPAMDTSTPLGRAFAAVSSGFPSEISSNRLDANPFKFVLRCFGPQRAGDLVLRA